MSPPTALPSPWWKEAVVYQIYPASFKDSNEDGIGDICGVISKLDHIKSLGADTIWLCPIFESPQDDLGYDISNYEKIHEPYGSVGDVEALLKECKQKNLRLILDLVVNHTSSEHAWFKESQTSRTNPKAAWYIWKAPKYDDLGRRSPPNNWRSNFGGSAWEWCEPRQEYYLHLFSKSMPDLNWECQDMREAIYSSAMRFWLDKGIDGFRIDTMTIYAKHPEFPDAPVTDSTQLWQMGSLYYRNQPKNFDYLAEMNEKVLSKYGDLLTVGEYGDTSDTNLATKYCSAKARRVGMGFQFETVCLGYNMCGFQSQPWTLSQFKQSFGKWQRFIENTDAWCSVFIENHDIARAVSRFGSEASQHWSVSAKMLAMLECTSTGTLFVYQGQEIGMTNVPREWPIEEYKDINTQNYWKRLLGEGSDEDALSEAMANIRELARDNARTPMQWDDSEHSGFTGGGASPWMRINDNFRQINVKTQKNDNDSILSFWKRMLAFRKEHADVCIHGTFEFVEEENESVISYIKRSTGQSLLVILNFTATEQPVFLPTEFNACRPTLSNQTTTRETFLEPYEGRLYLQRGLEDQSQLARL